MIIVAAGIIIKDGKILIARRKNESHLGRFWEFPGGKKINQEDLPACLIREVREEIGIGIRVFDEILSTRYQYPERTVEIHFFRCEWIEGNLTAHGCEELLWIDENRLDQFTFPPANFALLQRLKRSSLI